MIYLDTTDIILLHEQVINLTGGANGIRDKGALQAAVIQPQMAVFGTELYHAIEEKAAILGFGLISNHPFIDGNKRIGHAAMEYF